jgi:hypothetical protein
MSSTPMSSTPSIGKAHAKRAEMFRGVFDGLCVWPGSIRDGQQAFFSAATGFISISRKCSKSSDVSRPAELL